MGNERNARRLRSAMNLAERHTVPGHARAKAFAELEDVLADITDKDFVGYTNPQLLVEADQVLAGLQ